MGPKMNSKAVAARDRKAAQEEEKREKEMALKEAAEAKSWSEGARGKSKKDIEEEKRKQALARKAEIAALSSKEEQELESSKPKRTQTLIGAEKIAAKKSEKVEKASEAKQPIETYTASNVDDALALFEGLKVSSTATATVTVTSDPAIEMDKSKANTKVDLGTIERHPERRAKAAYAAFEEREMPRLKAENPTLRLSQLRQILQKEWKKSPENPFNQQTIAFDTKRSDERQILSQQVMDRLESLRTA